MTPMSTNDRVYKFDPCVNWMKCDKMSSLYDWFQNQYKDEEHVEYNT